MTLIIGAKCKDGVVILSDSRISRGNDLDTYLKIFQPINHTFIGAAGATGIFFKFLKQVNQKVQSGEITDWDELIEVVEDLVLQLSNRYYRRTGGDPIDVLMALKPTDDKSEIYHITSQGIAEEIQTIMAVGHGEPYASLFLKTMWDTNMTMKQTAILGNFILSIIHRHGMDSSVDDQIQIGYVPSEGDPHYATIEDILEIDKEANRVYGDFIVLSSNLLKKSTNIESKT